MPTRSSRKMRDNPRTFWKRIEQLIAKIPFIVRFLLLGIIVGIIVTKGIGVFYELKLCCILEYRISDPVAALIVALFTAIGIAITSPMPSEQKNIFWGFGGGVLVVFLLFLIRIISLPPIPLDECFPIHSPTPTDTSTLVPSPTSLPPSIPIKTSVPMIGPLISPTSNAMQTPSITTPVKTPPPTGDYPELEAAYGLCEDGEGKIRGTLYATGGNGVYSYKPSEVFERQRGDTITLVVSSEDGQDKSTTLAIDIDEVFPNCSSANPMHTAFLEVKYDIEYCYNGESKILVTFNSTGGDGDYSYTKSQEFAVQIDDTVDLVVTSGDGQVWTDTTYIAKELMKNCTTDEHPKDGGGDEDGGGDGGGGGGPVKPIG